MADLTQPNALSLRTDADRLREGDAEKEPPVTKAWPAHRLMPCRDHWRASASSSPRSQTRPGEIGPRLQR